MPIPSRLAACEGAMPRPTSAATRASAGVRSNASRSCARRDSTEAVGLVTTRTTTSAATLENTSRAAPITGTVRTSSRGLARGTDDDAADARRSVERSRDGALEPRAVARQRRGQPAAHDVDSASDQRERCSAHVEHEPRRSSSMTASAPRPNASAAPRVSARITARDDGCTRYASSAAPR